MEGHEGRSPGLFRRAAPADGSAPDDPFVAGGSADWPSSTAEVPWLCVTAFRRLCSEQRGDTSASRCDARLCSPELCQCEGSRDSRCSRRNPCPSRAPDRGKPFRTRKRLPMHSWRGTPAEAPDVGMGRPDGAAGGRCPLLAPISEGQRGRIPDEGWAEIVEPCDPGISLRDLRSPVRTGYPGMTRGPTSKLASPLMIGTAGFEPATPATPLQCATGLRHVPKKTDNLPIGEGGLNPISNARVRDGPVPPLPAA